MLKRVIPILLLKDDELVKSTNFSNHKYIGDIINAVKIFNELEVDEIIVMDITASEKKVINYELITEIANECFMPLSYGGNIDSLEKIEKILKIGVEKVCINSHSRNYNFVSSAVKKFGSSTVSICVDYKKINDKSIVFFSNGKEKSNFFIEDHIQKLNNLKVGEIIIQNIEKDGTYNDYDIKTLKKIKNLVNNPIVIAGGCENISSIKKGFSNGANACAAGSLFVYYTKNKGILINYPDKKEFEKHGIVR